MARVTKRAMTTATKRSMATHSDNTDDGYHEEGGGHLMAAMMGMALGTRPLAL